MLRELASHWLLCHSTLQADSEGVQPSDQEDPDSSQWLVFSVNGKEFFKGKPKWSRTLHRFRPIRGVPDRRCPAHLCTSSSGSVRKSIDGFCSLHLEHKTKTHRGFIACIELTCFLCFLFPAGPPANHLYSVDKSGSTIVTTWK